MTSTYVYGIGAIFLLAALMMYGTMSGFLPKVFYAGRTGPAIFGILLLGLAVWYGPDIWAEASARWASMVGNDSVATEPRSAAPAASRLPAAAPAERPASSPPKAAEQPAQHWKTTVVDDATVPPAEASPASPTPVEVIRPAEPVEPAARANDSDEDPYDSGLKRAVKHVGRFLHIAKKTQK